MIARLLAIAIAEFRIQTRNRWLASATVLMLLFALALTFAGSAPTGTLGVDLLTVAVASMTTLAVYLAPFLALMIAFDAVAGEAERGTLGLTLTYPLSRGEMLLGKFTAHLAVLAIAITLGLGAAGLAAWLAGGAGTESARALARLIATSILLGASFLALGYAASALSGSGAAAAGLAVGLWLVLVVLYDLGLLGALVFDQGGDFTKHIFPWLLAANPADAFRLWNVAGSQEVALISGMAGAGKALPGWAAPLSLFLWPVLALVLARAAFARVEP
ncbi:ABC transporter permease [Paracoccus sp. EGI L200073]|nr:ABC transporter permease subunit [Paracoccus salsus]MCF3973547.1 ABC transporter permease [Paracoccus salsus]